jgi:hypothetical protein
MLHVDPAQLASSPAPAGPEGARALVERQLAALSELAEIGMEIARAAGPAVADAAAKEAAESAFRGDAVLAYTRVARAVRLTFALQVQLLKDLAGLEKAEAKAAYERRSRRRMRVQRLVEEALDAERPDASDHEFHGLCTEARERLRDADDEADLLGRPFPEIVARICGDLGLSAARTAQVVAATEGRSLPSPSGAAEGGDSRAPQTGACTADGAPLQDDGEEISDEEWDTFLEWPPPPG